MKVSTAVRVEFCMVRATVAATSFPGLRWFQALFVQFLDCSNPVRHAGAGAGHGLACELFIGMMPGTIGDKMPSGANPVENSESRLVIEEQLVMRGRPPSPCLEHIDIGIDQAFGVLFRSADPKPHVGISLLDAGHESSKSGRPSDACCSAFRCPPVVSPRKARMLRTPMCMRQPYVDLAARSAHTKSYARAVSSSR